jgi:signal transduction histidine kinase
MASTTTATTGRSIWRRAAEARRKRREAAAARSDAAATAGPIQPPPLRRSLSARLLVLTIIFVLFCEVLIYVPSIARYRHVYLEDRIAAAHLATLSLEAAGATFIDEGHEEALLRHAGVRSITLRGPRSELMLGRLPPVDAVFDTRHATPLELITEAFETLAHGGGRTIRVIGPSPQEPGVLVDITLDERPMWRAMVDYSGRILTLSIIISVLTALLVFLALYLLFVRPMRRVAASVVAFRRRPEDAGVDLPDSARGDEIGLVQRELARMQKALRGALAQKTRLAALGAAVGKINHDLRNLLSSAILLSDRLAESRDPQVRSVAPRLVEALDRATRLCAETLNFSRAQAVVPRRERFTLRDLVEEVGEALLRDRADGVTWRNEVGPEITVNADRDQLFRVLMNLGRNAEQALGPQGGIISLSAWRAEGGELVLEVADTGGGIPPGAREHLFEAFAGSTRPGGTGLGLPIARELMRAHGGDILLGHTGPDGTAFRLTLPPR